ncbi:MAG: spore maturation protein [Firmicutes bacterium HGW-Firmicutes-7]|nr:MAG: spore maturation protein [Firmicutes bacterium HGW-Firmicutes-7]
MKMLMLFSDVMIPLIFVTIICIGLSKKVPVFDAFIEGAKEGIKIVVDILPTLIGLMIAVGIVSRSGLLGFFTTSLKPLTDQLGFPAPLLPIAMMRTISASATTGLVLDLFKTYGPDSFVGRMASIMMGCTETIFYTMTIYFMSINIKKTRYTLVGALLVTLVGIIASVIITYSVF